MRSDLAGTVARSSSPTMIVTGHRTAPNSGAMALRSMTPLTARQMVRRFPRSMASQVARSAARAGSSRNGPPNITCITGFATRAGPSQRHVMLSRRYFGMFSTGSASAEVSSRIRLRSNSGRRAASRMPTNPPIDKPAKWQGPTPRCVMSAAASAKQVSIEIARDASSALCPWPR